MAVFQLINVHVAIGGDIRSVVAREWPDGAVTWPEYELLSYIHGAGSLQNPEVIAETVERSMGEEKNRLLSLYGDEAMSKVYAGSSSNLPTDAPDEMPRAEGVEAKPAKKKSKKAKAEDDDDEAEPEAEPAPEPEAKAKAKAEEEEVFGRVKSKIKTLPDPP
jgi:hypothetical protein